MRFLIPQHIDLARENVPLVYAQALIGGDSKAHEWQVHVHMNGKGVVLDGCSATAYIRRDIVRDDGEDEPALRVEGTASGNICSVVFPADVYDMNSPLVAVMRVTTAEGDTAAMAVLRATSESLLSGSVYSPEGEIVNLDELLAQIQAAANAAAEAANAAAEAANEAASHAPYIDAATNHWMAWDTGTGAYKDTDVSATGPKGDAGTDGEDGADGSDGLTPYIGSNGNWWIGTTDTGVQAQGPAGENGTGSGTVTGVTVGGTTYEPDASGVVDLGDLVGGAWAERLLEIYPVDSIYMSVNDTSPAALFGGTWEQLKDCFLLGAGDIYTAGSTGGEAEHTLTVDEMPNHYHNLPFQTGNSGGSVTGGYIAYASGLGGSTYTTSYTGGSAAHNNMPPYLTVYVWKRVS